MSDRGRVFLIIAAVVLVGLLLSARMLAGFYVDYLWHASVDRTDVFWGILWSKLSLFAMFGGTFIALAVVNLVIADRLAPSAFSANTHPVVERFHEFFGHRLKLLRIAVAVVLGLLFAIPTMGRWQDWEMFQNSKSFGINDPRFGNDVGFYLFKLPFVTFVVDWLFIALVFITILVILTHVLSGGIVLQPPRPKLRRATKAHIAVLLSLLALVKAGDYWLTRYELTTANRGAVRGITYAVDNAQLPAVLLLAMIAILTAALYLSTLKTDRWRPAVVASALWALVALIGGIIYPAAVQSLVVKPNQTEKEAQYIDWNIEATRHALGIDNVEVREVDYGALTRSEVSANVAALQDVRLWRPDAKTAVRFRTDDGASDTTVLDVDVDRYEVDGRTQQVLVGARELDLDQVGNRSWQGLHLINTHGCGLVTAPASQVNADDKPAYRTDIVDVTQPELYFSPSLSGYSIVNTSVDERACDGREDVAYEGDAGVQLNSVFRRLAFALDELDYNLIGSSAINDDSRLLSIRDVRDRVKTIAPFLTLDGDPYPVVIDGTVVWVIDAYTTSNRYPFGESADTSQLSSGSGLGGNFNYVRNSVKATVNAYDGSITLYAMDGAEADPVLEVWRAAFPDLFTPASEMPDTLREHLRYPEELFRVQTTAYSKYRLDAADFFARRGAWSVALAPREQPTKSGTTTVTTDTSSTAEDTTAQTDFASDSDAARFVPYYTMFHAEGSDEATFAMFRPFSPFSASDQRKELVAYMLADSDPGTYGQLVAYVLPASSLPDGPFTVGAAMDADRDVGQQATLLDQGGSTVEYGDLQMVPVGDGLLWVRPFYVESQEAGQRTVKYVIVEYNGNVGLGESLAEALAVIFPGFSTPIGDVVNEDQQPSGPSDDATPEELLQQAEALFDDADAALKDGDLGLYAERIEAARALVQQALDLLNG